MTFIATLKTQLIPAAQALVPSLPWPIEASVLIGAICLQESGGENVQQAGAGPAKGYPQFEVEAIEEMLTNTQSAAVAKLAIVRSGVLSVGQTKGGVPPETPSGLAAVVHANFLNFPNLQIALARIMLWDNPNPLPALGNTSGAWLYYVTTWRPGKPRPNAWSANYAQTLKGLT